MISHCDLRAACDGRALAENMDDAAQQTTLAASSLAPQPTQALLSVLFYDDRYNETRDRATQPLYRALDRLQVPFIVGPPLGTVEAGVGRPGSSLTSTHTHIHTQPHEHVHNGDTNLSAN